MPLPMKTNQNELRSPDDKLKNVHKLKNIGDSNLVLFVCSGLLQHHQWQ